MSIMLSGCSGFSDKKEVITHKNKPDNSIITDTTPKVIGIGGIFFKSKNPKKTKEWYSTNLGMAMNDYGSMFKSRNIDNPKIINYLQWSSFDTSTTYFKPSEKEFMINYRVQNIEGLVINLSNNGVIILDSIKTYEYGKFVHIMDNDGNKLELWEPNDSFSAKTKETTDK